MKSQTNSKYDVFISHSAKDREFVTQLATDLVQAGLNVWLDQWNIKVGDSFAQAIDEAIKESRFLLIVMSPDYFQSTWTRQEWQYGLSNELQEKAIRVIPVLYRECDIPPMLRTKQWVDFRDHKQYKIILDRLVVDLYSLASERTSSTTWITNTEAPKPGERVEELDPNSILAIEAGFERCSRCISDQTRIKNY